MQYFMYVSAEYILNDEITFCNNTLVLVDSLQFTHLLCPGSDMTTSALASFQMVMMLSLDAAAR